MEKVRAEAVRPADVRAGCESYAVSCGAWVSVKEYAAMKGISRQAVMKAIEKGKVQSRQIPGRNQHGVSYEVQVDDIDNLQPETATCNLQPEAATCNLQPEAATCNLQPEAATCNLQPEATTDYAEPDQAEEGAALPGLGDEGDRDLGFAKATPQAMECRPSGTGRDRTCKDGLHVGKTGRSAASVDEDVDSPCSEVKLQDAASTPERQDAAATLKLQDAASTIQRQDAASRAASTIIEYVPYHKIDEAQLYALLMDEISRRLRTAESKTAEWAMITAQYNQGELVPELKKLKGHRSERALRLWWQKWQDSQHDMFELVHKNTSQVRGRKVTYLEQRFLEGALLCGWERPIMSAIMELKAQAHLGTLESPTSIPTLKRWCRDYAQDNPDVWTQGRMGDKAVKDTIVKSIQRDDKSIKPLQVYVVDGHKLSVYVKHPLTGKSFRPTLIMIFDWGSRYPVGMSLALTEDSSYTLAAVRNSLLNGGVIPPFFYLDNGKAFRSALFNAKWEEHDLEKDFAGIFPRLGIDAHFARAYNARAKVVERFFKTFQEQWEKRQKSYCGSSIGNKPAALSRNEEYMQKMFGAEAMSYNDCMNSIYEWVRYEYGMRDHQGINAKPYEVFRDAERPENRLVDPVKLNFLMLTAERKRLREEGIMLFKNRYWDPKLVKHVGQPVIIRYDYADLRSIFVYDMQSRYICQADLRESQCAWVYAEMNNPLAAQKLWAEDREISGLHRQIRRATERIVKIAKGAVEEERQKHIKLIDARKAEVAEGNRAFVNPPMMPAPQKAVEVKDEIRALEEKAMAAERKQQDAASTDKLQDADATYKRQDDASTLKRQDAASTTPKVINLEDLLAEEEPGEMGSLPYNELLVRTGKR